MITIQVSPRWHTVRITVPQSASVVCSIEAERIGVLPQAVQVGILRQIGPQSQVLALEDNGRACCVEEHFTRALSHDGEGEWALHELEDKLGRGRRCTSV